MMRWKHHRDSDAFEMDASALTCSLPCAAFFMGDGARCKFREKMSSGFG